MVVGVTSLLCLGAWRRVFPGCRKGVVGRGLLGVRSRSPHLHVLTQLGILSSLCVEQYFV
jgi:hypothetical protein